MHQRTVFADMASDDIEPRSELRGEPHSMESQQSSTPRQVVAIIDDEPGVLTGLKRILDASGFAAEIFSSAEAFLARPAVDDLACLLIDINLGGMSGIELRRRLKEAGSHVPVIFITARDDDATRREAMKAGCAAYLRKPFAGSALIDAVTDAAGGARARM
jgi:FixJ family two-component response regulator